MALRCDDVRKLMAPSGSALPLSDERAGEVAEHLDQCETCDQALSRRIGDALNALPAGAGPSLADVRRRVARDRRQSIFLRVATAAAAVLALLGTGRVLLMDRSATPVPARPAPAEIVIPDPPAFAELREIDRRVIQSEGVVALYLQFCLSCLNRPTEDDKREFLIRALLVFREVRGKMRSRYEQGQPLPGVEEVTREGLSDALQAMRASRLDSVKLLPARINGFKLEGADKWRVDHLLGTTPFRLTLGTLPHPLNFAYLKIALGADDALMARIEEALWFDTFVDLPKNLEEKDPQIAPKAVEALLPLLSAKQQKVLKKITGVP